MLADHVRLFRKRPGTGWRHRVHEQILPSLCAAGARVVWTDLVIGHLGYATAAVRRQKLARNLRLLLLEHAEQPEDAFTLFNLGATYMDQGEPETALPYLRRCLEKAPAVVAYLPRAYGLLAQAQRRLGRLEEGLASCGQGRERFPEDEALWFEEGLLREASADLAGAQRCFERILQLPAGHCYMPVDSGLRGHLARHHLALAHQAQGRAAEAEAQWRAVVETCPHYGPAWLGLAELCLKQGRNAEVETMIERLGREPGAGQVVALLRARICPEREDWATTRQTQ
jgi:tetratricopeptide (TPR) repeat protein